MFDHEKLDVYRVSVEFVAWAYHRAKSLEGPDRHARDQLLRASQSIPLNIAEGNGKLPSPDRLRSWRIARVQHWNAPPFSTSFTFAAP